jgi:hypothetical protein
VNDVSTASARPGAGWVSLDTDAALRRLLVIGLFACGGLAVMQDDSWWQLRSGQLIWQQAAVPHVDPFSFALPGDTYWPNHEWLAQLLMYGAFALGGLPAVNVGAGVLLALTGWCLLATMGGPVQRQFLLCALVLPWVVAALSVRPQVFTLLAVVLLLLLLVRERYLGLPLVFLVWANLHGAVALGGLMMVGACLAALWFDRGRLRALVVTTGLCGIATTINPLGPWILLFPLESVGRLKQLDLTEWNAPGFASVQDVYFWLLLAAFAMVAFRRRERLCQWPGGMLTLIAALLGVMSVMSARNIPIFLLVAVVAASYLLPATAPQPRGERTPRNAGVVGAFALLTAGGLAWAYSLPWSRLAWQPLSDRAQAAIRACPQPMFNTYNTGGYLLWFFPQQPVFVDSRQDPYPIDLLTDLVETQQTGDYKPLFREYGFRSAIMEPVWPLALRLRDDGWRMTHLDDDWVVFVAPEPEPRQARGNQ